MQSIGPTYYTRYLVIDPKNKEAIGYVSASTLVCADDHDLVGDLIQVLPKINASTAVHIALQQLNGSGSDMGLITDAHGKATRIVFRGDCVRILANL